MTEGTSLDRPGFLARIYRILMTAAAAGVKRHTTSRYVPLRLRLMTVVAILGLIISSCCVMTGGAIHALKSGMHLMHEGYDPHLVPIKIENFHVRRNLLDSHCG